MKRFCVIGFLLLWCLSVRTNQYPKHSLNSNNRLFIITLDGFRWQELFTGADSALLNGSLPADDNSRALYWASSIEERRKKLMPFFWNVLARQGTVYGNRLYKNYMNVSNPYALSYPGYNELLTGRVDLSIFNNGKAMNQNVSVLEELNALPVYKNKVAAFSSWDAFRYILNQPQSSFYINSGFQTREENLSNSLSNVNHLEEKTEDKKGTRYDELTYLNCKEYIKKMKPSVVFLSFGGTDEAAHEKNYPEYLQQANNADRMIGELWQLVQTLPEYAGKTSFIITTDHGRGHSENWYTHGMLVGGSSQVWMGILGHSIAAFGEKKNKQQLYLKNVKELMLNILSYSHSH